MGIWLIVVIVLVVGAIAVAAGALDGPRRTRRRVVVREPVREVLVERPTTVTTERQVITEQRDPLL